MSKETLLKIAISKIPYLLSLQDRNPFSPTYGSFDREHWQYKKTDTPYASVQGAVLSLTLLYKNKLPNNPYYKNKRILEWIIAGIKFLAKIQKRNGSFDEYYPNEKSYIGTALTMYPCAEAFYLIKNEINKEDKKTIIPVLEKAANFLATNIEPKVMNQEAMATLSIYCINQTLKKTKLQNAVNKKIKFILQNQTKEGWFPEYEGCDVGYLSYTIDFLATYYQKSKDKRVIKPINDAIEFISYLIHPNGTAGGEYTARFTEYLVPHGFEVMAKNPLSNAISLFIEKAIPTGKVTSIDRLDNRYTPLYVHQYIQTYLDRLKSKQINTIPFQRKDFTKHFPEAGILIIKQGNSYIIIGTKKGGVIRIYDCKKKEIVLSDCGYVTKENNKTYSSTYLENKRNVKINNKEIIIKGKFYKVKWINSTPLNHFALRIILSVGIISKVFRELMKKILITRKKLKDIKFTRKIKIKKNEMIINDEIELKKPLKVYRIDKFSFRYMPSARFYQEQEIKTDGVEYMGYQKNFKIIKKVKL